MSVGRYNYLDKDMNNILKLFTDSKELMKLLSHTYEDVDDPAEAYLEKQLIADSYTPTTKNEASVYIYVSFPYFKPSGNQFRAGSIDVVLLCHRSLKSIPISRYRIFGMIGEVDKIMMNNNAFGISDIDDSSVQEIKGIADYQAYLLRYNTLNWKWVSYGKNYS